MAEGGKSQTPGDDALLRYVVETARGGMILFDSRGAILMFNAACERLFGYSRDEVLGRSASLLMPGPLTGRDDTPAGIHLHKGEPSLDAIGHDLVAGRRKDGSTFPLGISLGESRQAGEPIFVAIVHDLTESQGLSITSTSMVARARRKRIAAEAAEVQRLEAVGRLSGGVAHDFNNLLTAIIGNADMLAESLHGHAGLKSLADRIIVAGERGAALTQQMLAFGRKQRLQPKETDCNALVEAMRAVLGRTLRDDIEIVTRLDPALAPAYADPAQIQSAILNLSLNARDAMPRGGRLTIATGYVALDQRYRSLQPDVPSGDYVAIAVTDEGEGMPPAVRARAFEPFFTTKDVGKGSGLGLSSVYGFVKQSNGHVALYSEPSLGTTVRVYLPTAASGRASGIPAPSAEDADIPRGNGTVLVVEDDPFVLSHAVTCLEALGYRVIPAIDGEEAAARLAQAEPIDVLFSDIVIPGGMNGWELVQRAKQERPEIKVLLTSGYPPERLAARGHFEPTVSVLNKPYRKADLGRRIHEIMESR